MTSLKLVLGVSLTFITIAYAQEKKIQRADLPPAVEKTVAAQAQGATIRGFSQEKENGEMVYEVELTVSGHSKDISIDASGAIVEVEEQVALESLPAAVKDGLHAKAGQGKILKVESLTKHERLVAYEAVVQTAGKKSEVQVDAQGKPLDHEE